MDPSDWFTDGYTVASQTGSGNDGSPIFGAQRAIKGFEQRVNRRMVTATGVAIVTATAFLTQDPIYSSDRVWAPGADITKPAQSRRLGAVTVAHQKNNECTLYQGDLT